MKLLAVFLVSLALTVWAVRQFVDAFGWQGE